MSINAPWPWYVAGPLIGLTVPLLLVLGNRSFGISSSLRHICAACMPAKIPFFSYDWKKEAWNLYFVAGVLIGGAVAAFLLSDPQHPPALLPPSLFSWPALFTLRGVILMIGGGFLVGFGTRYAGGCTSGHAIMGLSTLQWPSLVATCSFMAGGFIMANLVLPYILHL
jgi:uncharacterized membrane protein YedE/YeeE